MVKSVFIFSLFSLFLGVCVCSEAVAICNGFVKVGEAAARKNDLSVIQVRMFSRTTGSLKYSTECAPNGHFFVPAYDEGEFVLRVNGPNGWSFEPSEAKVRVMAGACNDGRDIEFQFSGFSMEGKVVDASGAGPEGVVVRLIANGEEKRRTETTAGGGFVFDKVFPGKYRVEATHDKWTFATSHYDVVMPMDNFKLADNFVISGYDISGTVGDAVAGIEINVFSADKAGKEPFATVAVSATDGSFGIKGVPPGKYRLVPHHAAAKTSALEIDPPERIVVVRHDTEQLPSPAFAVVGFSVKGSVVEKPGGKGIPGIVISFAGHTGTARTGENGEYVMKSVRAGTYDVLADAPDLFFPPMSVTISSQTSELPELRLAKVHVCGTVLTEPASRREVVIREAGSDPSDKSKQLRTTTNEKQEFCFQVAPGKYIVSPVVSASERAAGLLLSPAELPLTVKEKPIRNVRFSVAVMNVAGKVSCLSTPCDPRITVSLVDVLGSNAAVTERIASGGEFHFTGVKPGTYRVSAQLDAFCWKSAATEIEVESNDVNDVSIVQSGFAVNAVLSHALSVAFSHAGKKHEFTLQAGKQRICLPDPGVYTIAVPDSCYQFANTPTKFDTAAPETVHFEVSKYKLTGTINVPQPDTSGSDKIQVKVGSEKVDAVLDAKSGGKSYHFTVWGKQGETLEISPVSTRFLFYPRSQSVSLTTRSCPAALKAFEGRAGLFVTGTVTPPIAGVKVQCIESHGQDREVLGTAETDPNGKYSMGPLYDDRPFKFVAEKSGFHFQEEEGKKGSFRTVELSRIDVVLTDSKTGQPLSGALISISSRDGYRANNSTSSKGTLTFANLFPSEYYVRPVLMEYEFKPSSQSVDLVAGKAGVVEFKGKRVAFSAYGKVKTLNGEPVPNVIVLARATTAAGKPDENVPVEEATSDAKGSYRLRGLFPGKNYHISVRGTTASALSGDAAAEDYFFNPKQRAIVVAEGEDNSNIDFFAVRGGPGALLTPSGHKQVTVSGIVKVPEGVDLFNAVVIQVFSGDSLSKPMRTIHLKPLTSSSSSSSSASSAPAVSADGRYIHATDTFQYHPFSIKGLVLSHEYYLRAVSVRDSAQALPEDFASNPHVFAIRQQQTADPFVFAFLDFAGKGDQSAEKKSAGSGSGFVGLIAMASVAGAWFKRDLIMAKLKIKQF